MQYSTISLLLQLMSHLLKKLLFSECFFFFLFQFPLSTDLPTATTEITEAAPSDPQDTQHQERLIIFFLQCNQYVTSNHQITNLVFPNFSHDFFQLERLKRKTTFLSIGSKQIFFLGFGPMKSLFSFQMLKLTKVRGKFFGKKDWWFDVTNKIRSS